MAESKVDHNEFDHFSSEEILKQITDLQRGADNLVVSKNLEDSVYHSSPLPW